MKLCNCGSPGLMPGHEPFTPGCLLPTEAAGVELPPSPPWAKPDPEEVARKAERTIAQWETEPLSSKVEVSPMAYEPRDIAAIRERWQRHIEALSTMTIAAIAWSKTIGPLGPVSSEQARLLHSALLRFIAMHSQTPLPADVPALCDHIEALAKERVEAWAEVKRARKERDEAREQCARMKPVYEALMRDYDAFRRGNPYEQEETGQTLAGQLIEAWESWKTGALHQSQSEPKKEGET